MYHSNFREDRRHWGGRQGGWWVGLGALLALAGCGTSASAPQSPSPPLAQSVYVFNAGNRTVSVIDARTDKVVDTVPVSSVSAYPSATWGAASGYVLLPSGSQVTLLKLPQLTAVKTVKLPGSATYATETGDGTTGMVVLPSLNQVEFFNLDASRGPVGALQNIRITGQMGPWSVATSPGTHFMVVPGTSNNKICVVPLHSTKEPAVCTVPAPMPHPQQAALSPDGRYYAVAGSQTGGEQVGLYRLLPTGEFSSQVNTLKGLPAGHYLPLFTADSRRLLLLNQTGAQLVVFSLNGPRLIKILNLPPGSSPTYAALSPGGDSLFITLSAQNAVAVVNLAALKVVKTVPVGPKPVSVVVGKYSFLSSQGKA